MKYCVFFLCFLALACDQQPEDTGIPEIESSSTLVEEDTRPAVPESTEIRPGPYTEYHPSGGVKIQGTYNDNLQREGLWVSWYENGVKWSESYYVNGKRDGHSLTFYPSGKVRYVGEYKNDEKTGTWTFYDEAGQITGEEKY